MKHQDQRTIGEQQNEEQIKVLDNKKQLVNEDQLNVPSPAVPRNEQTDQAENEQNNNQVNDPEPTTVPTREICAQTLEISKMSSS